MKFKLINKNPNFLLNKLKKVNTFNINNNSTYFDAHHMGEQVLNKLYLLN